GGFLERIGTADGFDDLFFVSQLNVAVVGIRRPVTVLVRSLVTARVSIRAVVVGCARAAGSAGLLIDRIGRQRFVFRCAEGRRVWNGRRGALGSVGVVRERRLIVRV